MALAIYCKASNSYLLERTVFPGEATEELFREIRNKRELFMINADYRKKGKCLAFTIAGLSEDLRVLDAALMLSGLHKIYRRVEMLIVDTNVSEESLYPTIMESDVAKAKLHNIKGKP